MNWTPQQLVTRGAKAKQGRIRNVAPAERRTYNGVRYDSLNEMRFAMQLDLWQKAGVIHEWQRQVPYELKVRGKLICRFVVDFEVIDTEGKMTIYEVKGFADRTYRLKLKLFKALFPRLKYEIVKVGKR